MINRYTIATFVVCALIVAVAWRSATPPRRDEGTFPVRSVMIAVSNNSRPAFIEQLRSFGESNSFSIATSHADADPRDVFIELWREDVMILVSNTYDREKFDVLFYKPASCFIYRPISCFRSYSAPPPETINTLISALRSATSAVPGVTFLSD